MNLDLRLEVIKCLLKFKNYNRVIRYCLLGNSSGSICMIINIKQILSQIEELSPVPNELGYGIGLLLDAVSLHFTMNNLNEDNRNLWMKDCELKNCVWKDKFTTKLTNLTNNADKNFAELTMSMMTSYKSYRPHIRKNLQQEYILNLRKQRAAEFYRRRSWKTLTQDFTQEKAIWYNAQNPSQFYRLDPTEGPSRIRRRMIQTVHSLDPRFFNDSKLEDVVLHSTTLQFIFESTYAIDKTVFESPIEYQLLKCIEDVRLTYPCVWVSQSGQFIGEFFVGTSRIGFLIDNVHKTHNAYEELPNHLKDFGFISWILNETKWVLKRRFKLRDVALEIFMEHGGNCMIAMNSTQERDTVLSCIESFLPTTTTRKPHLFEIQTKWLNGELSNFDYLTILNTAAGRSYNDIMQYPVFPFILTDYSSSILDLNKESTFRDLSKPISIQNSIMREKVAHSFAEKAEEYQRQLRLMKLSDYPDDMSIWAVPPYHYSSLYSNSATVLYYMIRIPPFTQKFIEFQDDEFDRPDRMFHTLESAWNLSTTSLSCMKEIIPEFFYLPEMFINSQDFNFGERLNGIKVDDVILPKWCSADARLFCLIHRAALESPFVTNQLNHWIDLIFGFKQTGKAALDAFNLFHPYTYYKAIQPDEITEKIRREAVEQMIENYGQIPKQLFQNRYHPNRRIAVKKTSILRRTQSVLEMDKSFSDNDQGKDNSENDNDHFNSQQKIKRLVMVCNSVMGITWGDWVGSPENQQTFINDVYKTKRSLVGKLFLLPLTKVTIKRSLKLLVIPKLSSVLLSNSDDSIQPLIKFSVTNNRRRVQVDSINFVNVNGMDISSERLGSFVISLGSGQTMVTSIAVYHRSNQVFFGMESGLIQVFHGDRFRYPHTQIFMDNFEQHWRTLHGHKSAVTHLEMGQSFAILASSDSDGNVALWDPKALSLIHFIDWQSINAVSQKIHFHKKSDEQISEGIVPIQMDSSAEVSAMCFSETLGDLVISRLVKQKMIDRLQCLSHISLFTINGKHVESVMLPGTVVSLSYTNVTEGRNVNAIAAATLEGRLTVMSSWNLQVIWKVKVPQLYQPDPISSVQYTHSGREIFVIHKSGHAQVLQSNKPDMAFRQSVYFWL